MPRTSSNYCACCLAVINLLQYRLFHESISLLGAEVAQCSAKPRFAIFDPLNRLKCVIALVKLPRGSGIPGTEPQSALSIRGYGAFVARSVGSAQKVPSGFLSFVWENWIFCERTVFLDADVILKNCSYKRRFSHGKPWFPEESATALHYSSTIVLTAFAFFF